MLVSTFHTSISVKTSQQRKPGDITRSSRERALRDRQPAGQQRALDRERRGHIANDARDAAVGLEQGDGREDGLGGARVVGIEPVERVLEHQGDVRARDQLLRVDLGDGHADR